MFNNRSRDVPLLRMMCGAASIVMKKGPRTFVFMIVSKCSSDVCSMSSVIQTPALFNYNDTSNSITSPQQPRNHIIHIPALFNYKQHKHVSVTNTCLTHTRVQYKHVSFIHTSAFFNYKTEGPMAWLLV